MGGEGRYADIFFTIAQYVIYGGFLKAFIQALFFGSLGVDGPSQMALEDLGMFRSVPNCVVFYPSDGVSCERAVELAANYKDMAYIRATRGNTPIIYKNEETFEIGKAKVMERTHSYLKACKKEVLCSSIALALPDIFAGPSY